MSVVGIDLGNESSVVAVARQRGIDVVLNDESKRETPSLVSFGEKQRFLGTSASSLMNPKNTVFDIKRLLLGPPRVHVRYLGEDRAFTPTQLLAMLLSNLRSIASKNLAGAPVSDCCIGVPAYFTNAQRRAVLDAAAIAGLLPLRLLHETTATALSYGIYKTDLPEHDPPLRVVFVDVGHSSMQVCVAAYKKGQLNVLSHAYDRNLGGRDFDEVLFRHFADRFKEEYRIDVRGNARASLRLRAACEKLKKVLSANPEAPISIECLMEEKDVRGFMRREEFEGLSRSILERVKAPLERALKDAGIGVGDVEAVEVVGSGSRVPAIGRILAEFFGKEPRRTMNASECIARGCALQCAILSPTFRVREFQIQECFPYSISLAWRSLSNESQGVVETEQNKIVIPKGSPFPVLKAITFRKSSTFPVDVMYADADEVQGETKMGRYVLGPFQSATGDCATVKFRIQLNIHGIVAVDSATMIEDEVTVVPKEPVKGETKMETDEVPDGVRDVDMADAKDATEAAMAAVENGSLGAEQSCEGNSAPMETDAKDNLAPKGTDGEVNSAPTESDSKVAKKKVKKTNIPISEEMYGAMSREDLQEAIEKEGEMDLQDRVMEDTKEKKNAVEAYVLDMRNKLHDKYHDFVDDEEREKFSAKLQEVEDWLYDEGEDESRGIYVAKLEELKKRGDPIEERYKESLQRGLAIEQLLKQIQDFNEAALSNDPKFEHIDMEEKQKVINGCGEAANWLNQKREQQDALPKYATPILTAADLNKKIDTLDRACRPILSKPKLAPPPKPEVESVPAESQPAASESQQPAEAEKNGAGCHESCEARASWKQTHGDGQGQART